VQIHIFFPETLAGFEAAFVKDLQHPAVTGIGLGDDFFHVLSPL
jgi:hypothetical protein